MQIIINNIIFEYTQLFSVYPNFENIIHKFARVRQITNGKETIFDCDVIFSKEKSDTDRILRAMQFRINNDHYDRFTDGPNCRNNFRSGLEFLKFLVFISYNSKIDYSVIFKKELDLPLKEDRALVLKELKHVHDLLQEKNAAANGLCSLNNVFV